VFLWSIVAALVAIGCSKDPVRASSGPPPPDPESAPEIRVHADNPDLAYRYFPGEGRKAETVTRIEDVPSSARSMVLVIPPEAPPGLSYVADLTSAGPDGTYTYKVLLTSDLDRALDESRGMLAGTAPVGPSSNDAPDKPTAGGGKVVMFSASWCGVCGKAKRWFRNKGIDYVEKDVEKDPGARAEMQRLAKQAGFPASQLSGVPVIWVNGKMFGGFDPGSIEAALRGS